MVLNSANNIENNSLSAYIESQQKAQAKSKLEEILEQIKAIKCHGIMNVAGVINKLMDDDMTNIKEDIAHVGSDVDKIESYLQGLWDPKGGDDGKGGMKKLTNEDMINLRGYVKQLKADGTQMSTDIGTFVADYKNISTGPDAKYATNDDRKLFDRYSGDGTTKDKGSAQNIYDSIFNRKFDHLGKTLNDAFNSPDVLIAKLAEDYGTNKKADTESSSIVEKLNKSDSSGNIDIGAGATEVYSKQGQKASEYQSAFQASSGFVKSVNDFLSTIVRNLKSQ